MTPMVMRLLVMVFVVLVTACSNHLVTPTKQKITWYIEPRGGLPHPWRWKHRMGPDFDIFSAQDPNEGRSSIVLYIGLDPNQETSCTRTKVGRVGVNKVLWCEKDEGSYKEATFEVFTDHPSSPEPFRLLVHVTVTARSNVEADQLTGELRGLSLIPVP